MARKDVGEVAVEAGTRPNTSEAARSTLNRIPLGGEKGKDATITPTEAKAQRIIRQQTRSARGMRDVEFCPMSWGQDR